MVAVKVYKDKDERDAPMLRCAAILAFVSQCPLFSFAISRGAFLGVCALYITADRLIHNKYEKHNEIYIAMHGIIDVAIMAAFYRGSTALVCKLGVAALLSDGLIKTPFKMAACTAIHLVGAIIGFTLSQDIIKQSHPFTAQEITHVYTHF